MPPERLTPLIDTLVDTLRDEADALDDLDALLSDQLDALRNGAPPDDLADAALRTQTCTAALDDLRQQRARQLRLLARTLGVGGEDVSLQSVVSALAARAPSLGARLAEEKTAVERRAAATRQRGETLRFALAYAADLNRELLVAMRGAADESGGQTYTAAGQSEAASGHSPLVNAIG
jgi:flagellar biosynthesis/type III secretory pathway chaperone